MTYNQTKTLRKRLQRRKESHIKNLHSEAGRLTTEAVKMGAFKVILFGSLANGPPCFSSDLDLIIILDSELDFLTRTTAVYKQLKPKIGVDLLVYTPEEIKRMGKNPLGQQANRTGRVLYEA